MSTIARLAFEAIVARLETIQQAAGYNTDAGFQVYAGVRYFNDDETFPIVAVFTGDETVEKLTYNKYRSGRSVNIEGYVKDDSTATVSIEQLIEDVQRAVESDDESLGGVVNVLDYTGIEEIEQPEAGSDIAGVRITYIFEFDREYGS